MDEPSFVVETLAWCNERRAERDMEPLKRLPKGRRSDPESCPCGKATGLKVRVRTYREGDSDTPLPLPVAVEDFVEAFDGGELPQYDEALA